jgi:hypothetical protein
MQFTPPLLHRGWPDRSNHRLGEKAMNALNYRLLLVHSKLDAEVRREHKRRFPNALRLLRLKKLRLAIKDRMYRLAFVHQTGAA